jgi:predicted aconitase
VAIQLTPEEQDVLAGGRGRPAAWALNFQIRVGGFFGARRMIPVASAHVAAEMGLLGDAGLALIEDLAADGASVGVPSITDPCSVDFGLHDFFGQPENHVQKERRLATALARMGMIIANSCIPYQTLSPPRFGEHLAWGDTGSVAFANSVVGARSNFEGGPAAVAAALTGRVPEYGYHLTDQRRGTVVVDVRDNLRQPSDWGALGCWIGRQITDYWQVPVISSRDASPTVDDLKHLAASLASYGSFPMFHVVGVTPEAARVEDALRGRVPAVTLVVERGEIDRVYASFTLERPEIDLVVFSAPQLSLIEVQAIVTRLAGRQTHAKTKLIVTVDHAVSAECRRLGYTAAIEGAGGLMVTGVCFYVMTPDLVRERHGYRRIVTNSAKLANIIAGNGYEPALRPMEVCIEAALSGRLVR